MNCFVIRGGKSLCGEVSVQGSKNSALPLIAACLLNKGKTVLYNCPDLSDIRAAVDILNCLGCDAKFDSGRVICNSKHANKHKIPEILCRLFKNRILYCKCNKCIQKCNR